MKKLARLTALLLTGALLLMLTACGAAPLVRERQAKQQILTASTNTVPAMVQKR